MYTNREVRFILASALVLALQGACAFKQEEPVRQAMSVRPVGSLEFQVQGTNALTRNLARNSDQEWEPDAPILLPTDPKGDLSLTVRLPSALLPQVRRVTAEQTGATSLLAVPVDWTPIDEGMHLKVSEILDSLPRDKESSVPLKIHFWAEGSTEEALNLNLRTPPSAPTVRQTTLTEWKSSGRPLARGVERLVSSSVNLSLLHIVEVSHVSELGVAVSFPIRLQGTLSTHETTAVLKQAFCKFSIDTTDRQDVLTTELYVLPLTDELGQNFMAWLDSHLPGNAAEALVLPGGTALFGIYGGGDRAAAVATQGFKPQAFETVQATASCRTRCGSIDGRDMAIWSQDQASGYWQSQGMPGLSRQCVSAQCRPFHPNHPYTPDQCTACAEFEITQGGLSAWDGRRFCMSAAPGNPWGYPVGEPWKVEKISAPAQVGKRNGSLMLNLMPATRHVQVRFQVGVEVAPSRTIPEALKAQAIQAPGAESPKKMSEEGL
jgi:hypothetical protein